MITKEKYDEIHNTLVDGLFTWQEMIEFCYLTTAMLDTEILNKFEKEIIGDEND